MKFLSNFNLGKSLVKIVTIALFALSSLSSHASKLQEIGENTKAGLDKSYIDLDSITQDGNLRIATFLTVYEKARENSHGIKLDRHSQKTAFDCQRKKFALISTVGFFNGKEIGTSPANSDWKSSLNDIPQDTFSQRSFLLVCGSMQQNSPKIDKDELGQKEKIEKMASWYPNVAQDQTKKIKDYSRVMAVQLTRQLGANDKDWGPANPKWKHVYDQVNLDIQSEINQFVAGQGKELGFLFQTKFADALSKDDVNALTEFSNSEKGKRYWKLSNEIAGLVADATSHMSDSPSIKPKSQPTAEELKSWLRFTVVSSFMQTMLGMVEKDKQAGRDTSGSGAIWFIFGAAMALHQDDFRLIASTYENDLPDFTAFNESPTGKRMVDALVTSTIDLMPTSNEILTDVMKHINSHQSSWKQMYCCSDVVNSH